MNFLIHFYLTHFLADYPFQSGALVKLKKKRFLGVFIHSSIHLVTMLVILFPLLHEKRVWLAVALVYITHNIIDHTKVKLDKANPKYARLLYFLDQFAHWTVIYAAAYIAGNVEPNLKGSLYAFYMNKEIFLFILVFVLATYFYDVTRYFVKLQMNKPFERDYNTMCRNGLIVTIAFAVYWHCC